MQHRILCSATVRFGNGGDLRLNDFLLDWPHHQPDHELLRRMVVQNLRLLMVHDVELHDTRILQSPHKGLPVTRESPAPSPARRVVVSAEGAPVDVPRDRPLPAALVELTGHQHDEITELTVYGAWAGHPVLVLSGARGHHLTAATTSRLRDEGLRWLVVDAPLSAPQLPVTVAPTFVAALDGHLLNVALADDRQGRHLLVGTLTGAAFSGWSSR